MSQKKSGATFSSYFGSLEKEALRQWADHMKRFWIAALMAIRGQEVHLKTEAYIASNEKEAYLAADQNCKFLFPPEEGFRNHLTSIGEVPGEQLRALVAENKKILSAVSQS